MSARTGDPRKTLVPKTIMAESTNEVTLDDAGRNQISVSGVSGLAPSQVWGAGLGHCGKSSKHLRNFRVGTLNVNTLKGRVCEVVETLSRRKVDLCCVQETRYRGGHCRIITGKDSRYKLFWSGNSKGTAGVGVFVAEKWIEKVFEVKRVSDQIILVKIIVCQRVLCLRSVYAPQCGLSDSVKDLFYDQLRALTAMIPSSEFLIPCGDWNGHVGSTGSGYKEVHGGYGYGKPDPDSEGERILEYALAYDLFLGNTCFKKRDSHLITYRSGNTATQIDFMLFRKSLRKLVMDVKVIPGEEAALQHQLLVCDMMIDMPPQIKRKFTPRPKVWKLRDPQTCSRFQEVFKAHVRAVETKVATTTEEIWAKLKTGLLKTTEEVCGTKKPHRWRRETWW